MSIFDKMKEITSGRIATEHKKEVESRKAVHGDIIDGVINNIVTKDKKGKGGYGFITSPQLKRNTLDQALHHSWQIRTHGIAHQRFQGSGQAL